MGAVFIFVGYYVIALPVGIPLMFKTRLEAAGLWWGLTVGLILEAVGFVLLILKTDWEKEAELVRSDPVSRANDGKILFLLEKFCFYPILLN